MHTKSTPVCLSPVTTGGGHLLEGLRGVEGAVALDHLPGVREHHPRPGGGGAARRGQTTGRGGGCGNPRAECLDREGCPPIVLPVRIRIEVMTRGPTSAFLSPQRPGMAAAPPGGKPTGAKPGMRYSTSHCSPGIPDSQIGGAPPPTRGRWGSNTDGTP